jgi:hypothetical protein
MNNLYFDSKNDINDVITDSDDLLYSRFYGVRQFRFLGREIPLVGVVLEETDDSFLVGMPVMIAGGDGYMQAAPVDSGRNPFIRLMKSAVGFVALPTEPQDDLYIEYLIENSPSVFPDLLEMIGLKELYPTA